jgi:hypothetical protein
MKRPETVHLFEPKELLVCQLFDQICVFGSNLIRFEFDRASIFDLKYVSNITNGLVVWRGKYKAKTVVAFVIYRRALFQNE